MNEAERHDRVTQVFLAACELPEEKRRSFLNQECADDPELLADVETMLREDSRNPHFLETPALGEGFDIEPAEIVAGSEPPPGPIPSRIGNFDVLEVLGEGGMGIVYLAEQDNPRRRVALKVVRPGIGSESVLKRFGHESHILGRLQHPGIAQVFDAGLAETEHEPRPYFAMEYVKGLPLIEYAETRGLGTRERLILIGKVCDAVHHAHQKGVIHRDLKPGNILVDESGQPKILDFGVARATDADLQVTTMRTDVGRLIGTISYMSPEQIEGNPDALDTRSDVYALGVICYKLLTGSLPYDLGNKMIHEAAKVICNDDPT